MSKTGGGHSDSTEQAATSSDLQKQKTARDELFDNSLEASLSVQDSLIDAHLSANITPHEVKNILDHMPLIRPPFQLSPCSKKSTQPNRSIDEIHDYYNSLQQNMNQKTILQQIPYNKVIEQERLARMELKMQTGNDSQFPNISSKKQASQTQRSATNSKANPYVTNLTGQHTKLYTRIHRKKIFASTKGSIQHYSARQQYQLELIKEESPLPGSDLSNVLTEKTDHESNQPSKNKYHATQSFKKRRRSPSDNSSGERRRTSTSPTANFNLNGISFYKNQIRQLRNSLQPTSHYSKQHDSFKSQNDVLSSMSKQTQSVREEDQLIIDEKGGSSNNGIDTTFTQGFPKIKKQQSPQGAHRRIQLAWNFRNASSLFKKGDPLQEQLMTIYQEFKQQNKHIESKKRQMQMEQHEFQKNQSTIIQNSLNYRYSRQLELEISQYMSLQKRKN